MTDNKLPEGFPWDDATRVNLSEDLLIAAETYERRADIYPHNAGYAVAARQLAQWLDDLFDQEASDG
jgi:hypothetical protein